MIYTQSVTLGAIKTEIKMVIVHVYFLLLIDDSFVVFHNLISLLHQSITFSTLFNLHYERA